MFAIKSDLVLFFIFFHVSNCQRRIQEGEPVTSPKRFVVYLVKAPIATTAYDYWLCGGAIVSSQFVVTSAACIRDVDYLYVIAGYNKYVIDKEIELDPCTSQKKKKVIYTCFPDGYDYRTDRLEKWSLIDIGVVKVESPFDFTDQSYNTICSYIPAVIPISYEAKYQEPGTDAIVFGWGHLHKWRKIKDSFNYNQEILKYAPVMIMDKEHCKKHYEDYRNMTEVIDKYMICTLGGGNIDDNGQLVEHFAPKYSGCNRRKSLKFIADEPEDCEDEDLDYQEFTRDDTRRGIKKSNQSCEASIIGIRNKNVGLKKATVTNRTAVSKRTAVSNRTAVFDRAGVSDNITRRSRRYGICQNDHGGPLVTWVGSHEILIGIASVFKVSEDSDCIGPYLYTSTQCNGAFLDCILERADWPQSSKSKNGNSRRALCKRHSGDAGNPTIERHISWLYHPAGAAANEKHEALGRNEDAGKRQTTTKEEIVNENYKYEANERYPLNEKVTVNDKYALNERYIANIKYVPNEGYAANNKYAANYQYAPNEGDMVKKYSANIKFIPNNRYAPNDKPAPNYRPAQNNWPAQNNMPAPNYSPALNANEKIANTAKNKPGLIMRPQRPLRN